MDEQQEELYQIIQKKIRVLQRGKQEQIIGNCKNLNK